MQNLLYEDEQIIVVWKPVGMEAQASRGFGADMVSEIKKHIHKQSPKSGEPYVGVIHRLDKPVSGVMVYAKDKTSAAALSKQVTEHQMKKKYLAVLCTNNPQIVDNSVDKFVDYMLKDEKNNISSIVDMGITGAKRAELDCRIVENLQLEPYGTLALAEVELFTGRHHQIRVQMAGHGMPIWGDNKYNPQFQITKQRVDVALAAYELSFFHPATGKWMTFRRMPDGKMFRHFHTITNGLEKK